MARLESNIPGGVKERVGTIVGSSWKGVPYIKARPRKRGKKRRPGERLNQSRFATAHYWLQTLIEFLRIGFRGYAARLEGDHYLVLQLNKACFHAASRRRLPARRLHAMALM